MENRGRSWEQSPTTLQPHKRQKCDSIDLTVTTSESENDFEPRNKHDPQAVRHTEWDGKCVEVDSDNEPIVKSQTQPQEPHQLVFGAPEQYRVSSQPQEPSFVSANQKLLKKKQGKLWLTTANVYDPITKKVILHIDWPGIVCMDESTGSFRLQAGIVPVVQTVKYPFAAHVGHWDYKEIISFSMFVDYL